MAKVEQINLHFSANAKEAKRAIQEIKNKTNEVVAQMDALARAGKQNSKEYKTLNERFKLLNSLVTENVKDIERVKNAVNNLSKTSLRDLKSALAAAKSELNKMSASSPGLKQMQNNVKALQGQIDKLSVSTKSAGSAFSSLIKHGAQMVSMYMGLNALKSTFTDITRGLFKFSDQLTDIRKVSGLTAESVNQISDAIMKIDTRTSAENLNKLAYIGSKLGIVTDYGKEGLIGFVKAADQLGTALHEDLGEDAVGQLAKMVQVMGDAENMGVERALLATGSAIFKLSTSSTANGENIMQFSKRLTGMAKASKMTTPELLALGSAADSMMLMPEVASTAMNKFIMAIQKNWNLLEKDLNMKQGELKAIIEDPKQGIMGAIMTLLPKMKEVGGLNALSKIFPNLDGEGARLQGVIVSMSQNYDMLQKHLDLANKEFSKGTAVTQEYVMQNQTAAALMERASNKWRNAFVNESNVDVMKELAKTWYEFTKGLTESSFALGTVKTLLTVISSLAEGFIKILPGIVMWLGTMGVAGALNALSFTMGNTIKILLTLPYLLYRTQAAVRLLQIQWATLSATMKANVIGVVVGAVTLLINAIANYRKEISSAQIAQETLNRVSEDASAKYIAEKRHLEALYDLMHDGTASLRDRIKAQEELNDAIPDLNAKINTNTGAVIENTKAWRDNFEQLSKNYELEGARQTLSELGQKRAEAEIELYQAQIESREAKKPKMKQAYNDYNPYSGYSDEYTTAASKYIKAQERLRKAKKAVADIDAQEKALKDKYGKGIVLSSGTPNKTKVEVPNPAKDKDALNAERQAKQEQERAWREELSQYQADAVAMVDNVTNFFERQLTEKLKIATERGMTEVEKTLFTAPLESQKNNAMKQLRFALAGQNNSWGAVSAALPSLMLEQADATGYNASADLIRMIQEADPAALNEKLAGVSANLNKPLNSTVAQIFRKGTENEGADTTAKFKAQQARMAAELERNYTGKVQQDYYDKFNLFGFANPNEATNWDARKQAISDMFESARRGLVELIAIGDSDKSGVWRVLFGDDATEMMTDSTLADLLKLEGEDFKLFYDTLIQYSDAYTQAQSKAKEKQNTTNKFLWEHSSMYANGMEAQRLGGISQTDMKSRESFGAASGPLAPWDRGSVNDPEITMFLLRLQMAQEYYDFLKAHNADSETLMAQQAEIANRMNDLTESVIKKAKTQADMMKKWCEPIEEYGTGLGEALADDTKSVKEATGEMIKSFIKLTGEYVNQKLTQWIMTKLYNGLIGEEEDALTMKKQVNAQANLQTQAAETQGQVVLGEASAAAKTLGELGWWGIPLIAVITAVLNGLLSFAMSKVSSAFGGGSKTGANTKLVSGMLTYDSGNVQSYAGSDGQVYSAQAVGRLSTGIVSSPIATTVNGAPALVGERGPEIVVGRETTAAIMRNDPGLLRMLVGYDKLYSGRRQVFDDGNVSDTLSVSGNSSPDSGMASLMAKLLYRLDNPVAPNINMYGRDGLHSKMQQANAFMKGR